MMKKLLAIPLVLGMIAVGNIGVADAQTAAPRLAIQLANSGLTSPLTAGMDDAVMARLILDTTGSSEAVRIGSLPFNLTTGNGADADTLDNCRVYNENVPTVAISSVASLSSAGINNISLNPSLVIAANTVTTLALRCDIGTDLEEGGTFTFSMNTTNVNAVGATTGAVALVSVRGATPVPTPTPTPTPTPGLPATGAGGEAAQNLMIIMGSLLAAGIGLSMTKKGETA